MSFVKVSRRAVVASALALAACNPLGGDGSGTQTTGQNIADPVARRFYAARGWSPTWDKTGAQKLTQIIAGARTHGLDPAAFAPKPSAALSEDEALTVAALAYAKALAVGFVEPRKVEKVFTLARNEADVAAGLAQALSQNDLEGWYGALAPHDDEYRALSGAYLAALSQSGLRSAPANGAPVGRSLAPADQARQLAANLERRRWLVRAPPDHRIDVNTAAASLAYFKPGQAQGARRVVAGREDHPTPSIEGAFHRLIANPPWRVPAEIAAKEILPKGDAYMAREDMHVEDGRVVQAPGPKSALGLVKFDVEDPYDIYLHDTPSKALFAADERHRSHGCVRVEDAVGFARAIAAETSKADAFDQALEAKDTSELDLGQSITVRMLYHTAYLGPSGQVLLVPDVYGTDDSLAAALGLGQAAAARQIEPEILFGP